MTAKKFILPLVILLSSSLVSCNLYSPLEGSGTQLDHLEIAQSCLTKGDYDCAAAEYQALAAGSLKEEKLCTVYLSQAGFGLSTLVTVFKLADKKKALGAVANKVLPYTAKKLEGAVKAIDHCGKFLDVATAGDPHTLAVLLKSLGYFVHCGVLMAKTTVFLGNGAADTTCTTPSTFSTVTAASISSVVDGSISASSPGMCSADADLCLSDVQSVGTTELGSGMQDILDSFTKVKAQLGAGASTQAARLGIIQTL